MNLPHDGEGKPDQSKGIGFGGTKDGQNCRIWIDKDYENKSYCTINDNTYESGPLLNSHIKKLKVIRIIIVLFLQQLNLVEVWGICHPVNEENNEQGELRA